MIIRPSKHIWYLPFLSSITVIWRTFRNRINITLFHLFSSSFPVAVTHEIFSLFVFVILMDIPNFHGDHIWPKFGPTLFEVQKIMNKCVQFCGNMLLASQLFEKFEELAKFKTWNFIPHSGINFHILLQHIQIKSPEFFLFILIQFPLRVLLFFLCELADFFIEKQKSFKVYLISLKGFGRMELELDLIFNVFFDEIRLEDFGYFDWDHLFHY